MKSIFLIAILLATPAAAQNLGTDTSAEKADPTTAWLGGIAPDMQKQAVEGLSQPDMPKGCEPVFTGTDLKEPTSAGQSLVPATRCIKPPLATAHNVTGQTKNTDDPVVKDQKPK